MPLFGVHLLESFQIPYHYFEVIALKKACLLKTKLCQSILANFNFSISFQQFKQFSTFYFSFLFKLCQSFSTILFLY